MKGFSRHHVLWERASYETSKEKRLRSHHGMVILLPNQIHYEGFPESIHTLLQAPPKPELSKIVGGLALLDSKPTRFLSHTKQVIEMMAQYFGTSGEEELGNHLYAQLDIIGDKIGG